ncbi:MAG: S-methyl-5-thioribose-1-phosphate isomerase [Candidatus Competibacteraceae bacterium]|jgi:methylthioribose-1-phosphate isomerase|nr:S-methyl-5-thioribose-1-phosphate isomerase [Candidatus Competibacteraceae bacterium]
MANTHDRIRAIVWRDEALELLDQRLLPGKIEYRRLTDVEAVAQAIRDMVVRGAPAIGITAAYGVVLAARARYRQSLDSWSSTIQEDLKALAAARPTAVNLFWALQRMENVVAALDDAQDYDPTAPLLREAQAIHAEDIAANHRMGQLGLELLQASPGAVLTHCNTGSLATGGYGTALGVIRSGFAAGAINQVYADETRPWLQGSRLTAWELLQDDIPVTLLADGAAAYLLKHNQVQWVIVGADRITANGDVANKIGTYNLALAAHYHSVRFMVAAPSTTIDMSLPDGTHIPIEQRAAEEVLSVAGQSIAAAGATAWNPSFDVTPATLITALVTERGIVHHPTTEKMARLLTDKH